jgi:hypothetical protein
MAVSSISGPRATVVNDLAHETIGTSAIFDPQIPAASAAAGLSVPSTVSTVSSDVNAYTSVQEDEVNQALSKAINATIPGGATAGTIENDFASNLSTYGTFSDAQIAALKSEFSTATGEGASFYEQGNSTTPFLNAWIGRVDNDLQLLANPGSTLAAPPASSSAPTSNSGTNNSGLGYYAGSLRTGEVINQIGAPATTTPTTVTGTVPTTTTATTPTSSAATSNSGGVSTDELDTLLAALGQNPYGAGSGSVDGGTATPDTSDDPSTLPTTTTTSSGPSVEIVVLVIAAIGVVAWLYFRHKKKKQEAKSDE